MRRDGPHLGPEDHAGKSAVGQDARGAQGKFWGSIGLAFAFAFVLVAEQLLQDLAGAGHGPAAARRPGEPVRIAAPALVRDADAADRQPGGQQDGHRHPDRRARHRRRARVLDGAAHHGKESDDRRAQDKPRAGQDRMVAPDGDYPGLQRDGGGEAREQLAGDDRTLDREAAEEAELPGGSGRRRGHAGDPLRIQEPGRGDHQYDSGGQRCGGELGEQDARRSEPDPHGGGPDGAGKHPVGSQSRDSHVEPESNAGAEQPREHGKREGAGDDVGERKEDQLGPDGRIPDQNRGEQQARDLGEHAEAARQRLGERRRHAGRSDAAGATRVPGVTSGNMDALLLTEYMKLEMVQMDPPEIGPDDLLVRVRACGICGSDVHGLDGSTGRRIPPLVMGHEAAGVVEKIGSAVKEFKAGDRVTFDSTIYCGQCAFCARGDVNLCDNRMVLGVSPGEYRRHGAFAEYVSVPKRITYKLPDSCPSSRRR